MHSHIQLLELQVKDFKAQSERLQKETDLQNQKSLKLQQELDEQMTTTKQLDSTNEALKAELAEKTVYSFKETLITDVLLVRM